MTTSTSYRRNLDQALSSLPMSARARRVLEELGIDTVARFVLTPRDQFLAHRGCGERTYAEIERKVCGWLAERLGDADVRMEDERPLLPMIDDDGVANALQELGLRTVGEFLARPRAEVQQHHGIGKRRYQRLYDAVLRSRRLPPAAVPLLPESLQQLPLQALALPLAVTAQLADLGCSTIGHALTLPAGVYDDQGLLGPQVATTLRNGLDQLFRSAIDQLESDPRVTSDWPTLRGSLLAPLDEEDRDWLCRRIGLDLEASSRRQPAAAQAPIAEPVPDRDAHVRARLSERAPTLVCRLRQEAMRELEAFEGLVRHDRLAAGSLMYTLARGSGQALLPLRLAAFCFPEDVHLHDGCLTTVSPRLWLRIQRQLRSMTAPRLLPRSLEEIVGQLHEIVDPVPRGLLLYLLGEVCHLRIQIDPNRGEVVLPQQPELSTRLATLLHEHGRPTQFEDLMFDYRERYRAARPQRLLSQLRADLLFLQIGPETWSLRAWHADELEQVQATAEQVVAAVCERGGKRRITDLCSGSERAVHLITDIVRRDPRLRYLGRGEVCPAGHERSQVLHDLLQDFRKAMGEVPMSRFVANQPPEKRRLVERLLVENRLFVFPSPDRIDVLTNYPFNRERLQRLTLLVDTYLAARNGYSPLDAVLTEVNRCDLGGSWLHPTLLGELLRRHGPFEVLPGGFVARSTLGLGAWLMRRARNALRDAAVPISVAELLAERPELAEFAPCLEQMLTRDPLVQTPDGARFQIA